jgi:predicted enzyme related to lactoylglutathione lyase
VFCLWEGKKNIGATVLGKPSSLIWTELMTGDTTKAKAFYTSLFPWNSDDMPMATGGGNYTRFKRGENGAGGMMQVPHPSIPPHWMPYFGVENCDSISAKATSLGAETIMPTQEIPNMGRFAIFKDPQGAAFAIFQPLM